MTVILVKLGETEVGHAEIRVNQGGDPAATEASPQVWEIHLDEEKLAEALGKVYSARPQLLHAASRIGQLPPSK